MKKITILALKDTGATTVTGPLEVFHLAGSFWNHLHQIEQTPYFQVELVTVDGEPSRGLGGVFIQAHSSIHEVEQTDLILISTIVGDIEKALDTNKEAIPWLRRHHEQGASIAAICNGSFILAETGLLDGKVATTHWGYAKQFRQRYPKIDLKPERLITDEGTLFCSGAANSCFDLSFYLIERFCGHEVTVQCAKSLLHDTGRISQTPYAALDLQTDHQDEPILAVQKWIEDNYAKEFKIEQISKNQGMSLRTFERRFKSATGDTPSVYLQRVRVEAAKRQLEADAQTFDEIVYQVGYEDSSFFRKVFKKYTGLSPKEYRNKFRRIDR